jgi:uncharacterized peroxidase-related enzyme
MNHAMIPAQHTSSHAQRQEAALAPLGLRRHETLPPAGTEPLSRFQVPEAAELTPELTQVYTQVERALGFLPNWLRALSINPDTACRLARFYLQLFDPERSHLSAAERELVAVVVSATNRCSYSVFNHTHALGEATGDPVRARRVALDHHHVRLSKRERLLADVAEKLTISASNLSAGELDQLRQAGFSEPAALEVLEVAAFFNYVNRLALALNVVPDQQFFAR